MHEEFKAGQGRGNWGHTGRPGKLGGSAPKGGGTGNTITQSGGAPHTHPDSINLRSPTKTVMKLGKYLQDNKSRIKSDTYKVLGERGQKILHNTSIVFRVGTPYNKSAGQMNRQALAKDLNDLADDIDVAIAAGG